MTMLLAPAFLLGLLAIGLPLWLHRFSRQSEDRRPFASLMLLEASEVHSSKRHTLRYLALLALRIGLLLALALAFAQPILPMRGAFAGGRDAILHVIALDTSLSMREGERWERALARARSLIDALRPGDRGMLVAADHRVRIVHGPVEGSAAPELRAALTSVEPGLGRLDYGTLMTSAEGWIDPDDRPARLHLVTDLQQSASPLRFADLEPPPGVELRIVDVGEEDAANVFIAGVEPVVHDANALQVRVRDMSPEGVARDVIVHVDGEERARRRVQIAPGAEQRMVFTNLGIETGDHRVQVTLQPRDSLPEDDVFHVVLRRATQKVLVLAARESGDDAAYLAAAVGSLTSPRLMVERSAPRVDIGRVLPDYAAVVVSDVGILPPAAAAAIEQYLEAGGAALLTLGPRAATLDVLPVIGRERRSRALTQTAARPGRVSVVEESHPVLRDAQGWRSVRFFRHVPLEPRADDAVLVRFESGPPLLLERRVGAGRMLVLASPLDREWNDLAIHPLFVRFIGEAARYLTGAGAGAANAIAGSVVVTGLSGRAGAQVFDPDGRRVLTIGETTGTARLIPERQGFYEVRGGERVEWIAVNVDPRESDLARMSPQSISKWRELRGEDQPAQARTIVAQTTGTDVAQRLLELWPWLLLVAVTLAFAEPLVANSYLHVRRGAQP